jgi:endoglucanase
VNNVNFFFQANRVGSIPQAVLNDVPWIKSSLAQEATAGPGGRDLSGGWLSGGAAYSTKATIPTAFAVTMMAWSLLRSAHPTPYSHHPRLVLVGL